MALTDGEKKSVQDALYMSPATTEAGMAARSGKTKGSYQFQQGAKEGLSTGFAGAMTGASLGFSMGKNLGLKGALIGGIAGLAVGGIKGVLSAGQEYEQAKKMQRAQEKENRRQRIDAEAYGRRAASKRAEGLERTYLAAGNPPEVEVTAGPGMSSYDAFKAKKYGA